MQHRYIGKSGLRVSPICMGTMSFGSTIIGARTADQLDETLTALDITLSAETLKQCDEVHKQYLYPMG